jgi:hypothetical protein
MQPCLTAAEVKEQAQRFPAGPQAQNENFGFRLMDFFNASTGDALRQFLYYGLDEESVHCFAFTYFFNRGSAMIPLRMQGLFLTEEMYHDTDFNPISLPGSWFIKRQ